MDNDMELTLPEQKTETKRVRVVFCWMQLPGYMAACFRELARRPGVELTVIALRSDGLAPFDSAGHQGFTLRLLGNDEQGDSRLVRELVLDAQPETLVISGWAHAPYARLARDPALRAIHKILALDNPIRFDLRQLLGRFWARPYIDLFDRVLVPGERAHELMRSWGVPPARVATGLYGMDYEAFAQAALSRSEPWPRRFVFAGRLVPVKGVETLAEAYRTYRGRVPDPWALVVCGTGPSKALDHIPGVDLRGFVQPKDLPGEFARAGAFVLPSWHDAWGVAIAEAAAAALPVICTRDCGASADLVYDLVTGLVIPARDTGALSNALAWVHENAESLPRIGTAGQQHAMEYSAARWANRLLRLVTR